MNSFPDQAEDSLARLRDVPKAPGPARTALLGPEELTAEQAELHATIAHGPRAEQTSVPLIDCEGRLLGPFALMLLAPAVGAAVQQVGAVLRTRTELSPRSRELAILTVAAHRRSRFEWEAHQGAALEAGLEVAQLQQILDGVIPDDLSEEDRCVVSTANELLTQGSLGDADYESALRILGEKRLAELIWLVGYYSMLAVALATLRPESS
ncbi:carboxymuconolactone decarboxylase family protein [Amycolatopsis bartoniae]|uniref:carboxymuconolactone decarboxylase family protein n=2 Tax=Amycolatopsis bartoniae TaxID=941986 RepID=UPI00119288F2|nr:carboxymuconolactone decarboxylase family protein [Amycolatopsis bartoniae]TVT11479.1 carboxymuconolactone decarboxylase family protein [Amycolatopsis bartoniae]